MGKFFGNGARAAWLPAGAALLYARFVLTLIIGGAGGYLFLSLKLPLPWMLGSMTAVTVSTLLRVPVFAPPKVRPPMTAVIGVLLGSSFHPGLLAQLPGWLPTLLGLALVSAISGMACSLYLHRIAGFDRTTAYFAGMPGGLVEMIEVGGQKGGDEVSIALIHSARILMVVFAVPFLVQTIEGVSLGARPQTGVAIADAPLAIFAQLLLCAALGAAVGKVLNLPAKYLLGPLLVSGILHGSGLSTFVPPREIVQGAQLVLGAVLGARFVSAEPRRIVKILGIAAGMTVVLITSTVLCAWGVGAVTGVSPVSLILAYSPGGLAEMSLLALALHTDVAFVASHHLARVIMVMVAAPSAFALMGRAGNPEAGKNPAE